ncbi:5-formyltetrahydrofolate cyclo-ligase [Nisaea acidiphila]|uniref:5-formyltetrahydrofolate cyclo-ligase n=1 Tax=Nisaea acidiphila TaxID=1862145 RepID=A0A9J7AVC9_9PROT|nr:5-formyltetrahydrofolate cyclo-ligase [Nisaea acidiphila]UUX51723.1 5-formyltetrahydrofolate cyclo-ligase [Nisaea acidiphila]
MPETASTSETSPNGIESVKAALRQRIELRRQEAHAVLGVSAGDAIRNLFFESAGLPEASVVAAYWPFRTEIDPRPLMHALHARGHRIVLPVVARKAAPLSFRLWGPGAPLVKAGLGGLVPDIGAPELDPTMLLVPMLAFDDAGYRLGYGGGFYDRTLEKLRAGGPVRAIGIAYEAQRVDAVPREATDQRLDALLTEAGFTEFGKA